MRILIAEDDPIARHLIESVLRRSGYDLIVCSNGVEAWDAIERGASPQMYVLDWMMPGIDGIEVCRRVRGMPDSASTYVIMLTARGRTEDIVAGVQAGADDYIIKPFARSDLIMRVQVGEWLVRAHATGLHAESRQG